MPTQDTGLRMQLCCVSYVDSGKLASHAAYQQKAFGCEWRTTWLRLVVRTGCHLTLFMCGRVIINCEEFAVLFVNRRGAGCPFTFTNSSRRPPRSQAPTPPHPLDDTRTSKPLAHAFIRYSGQPINFPSIPTSFTKSPCARDFHMPGIPTPLPSQPAPDTCALRSGGVPVSTCLSARNEYA